MDGVHDLGGKEGVGPIDVNEPEAPFHYDWEGRMWGISRSTGAPDWTIDWWRHVRELIDPVSYLSRRYFDSWAQTQIAAFVNSGVFTLEEVISGKSDTPPSGEPKVISPEDAIAATKAQAYRFDREIDQLAAYKVADRVRTNQLGQQHHTRLPAYARGKTGVIHAHHGAHVFPDANAKGNEVAQHLYTVIFEARELWIEAAEKRDRVFLNLWESYLEPA